MLIDRKSPDAVFEVGNEPDIGGPFVVRPPRGGMGSRSLYDAYFNLYSETSGAAFEFERENPGVKVTLGGPALGWAFTFRFGDFNWTERFLRDAGREKIKLDFIGVHFYGNISPLSSQSNRVYPSFEEMMRMTRDWRDQHTPGVPIWLTEWGATYHTNMKPQSLHNGNHVGAAFAAAYLNQMLTYMAPKRCEATNPGGTLGCIASRDDEGCVTVLIWNHGYRINEFGPGVEEGQREAVTLFG